MAFDKKKKYGELINRKGIKYVQDGKFYNRSFTQVDVEGNILPTEPPKEEVKEKKPAARRGRKPATKKD